MLLVILYHSCVFWTGKWWDTDSLLSSNALGYFATWQNSFHIYAFTLVSGYIFEFKVSGGGYCSYLSFLRNKAKRLLIPYVFVTVVWLIPISLLLFHTGWQKIINNYFLCTGPEQLWFLWMLFDVFVIIWPMRNLMLKNPLLGWVLVVVFYGIGIVGKGRLPNVFCIWTACQYVPFFFIGMRIRVKEENRENLVIGKVPWFLWIVADLIVFAVTKIVGMNNGTVWSMVSIGFNLILHIVGAVMVWTTLQALANKISWKNSKVFKTLSSYSMPMYLFHQQIIYFTIIWLDGKVNPWIHAGVNFGAALIGSFLISSIFIRWKATRFLIGEK